MCNIPDLSARLDLLLTLRELPICMEDLTPVRLALQTPHMHLSVMFVSACLGCSFSFASLFLNYLPIGLILIFFQMIQEKRGTFGCIHYYL